MSQGLNYLASVIENGAGPALIRLDSNLMIDEREQTVFTFTRDYYRRYREVPTSQIVREETGITLRAARGTLQFNLDQLLDRQSFEILRAGFPSIRDAVKNSQTDTAVAAMDDTVRRIRRTRRGQARAIDAREGMQQVLDRLDRVRNMGGASGIPTPWDYMNDQTGGYQESDIITYVARTGQGKTALLLRQADEAYEQGYSALVVTTEMNAEQITRRWMAMRYGLNPQLLKKGTISTHLRRKLETWTVELLGRERFRILPLGTGAELAAVEAAIDELAPEVVYVDGIYLFRSNNRTANQKLTDRVTAVYDELKQQSIDTKLPYIVNTQFNRQAGKGGKDGSIETIGLSDAIGWHSSLVIAVKPGPTDNPNMSRELEFLKGREGEVGSFAINFKFRPVDFSQIPAEELAEMSSAPPLNNADEDWE